MLLLLAKNPVGQAKHSPPPPPPPPAVPSLREPAGRVRVVGRVAAPGAVPGGRALAPVPPAVALLPLLGHAVAAPGVEVWKVGGRRGGKKTESRNAQPANGGLNVVMECNKLSRNTLFFFFLARFGRRFVNAQSVLILVYRAKISQEKVELRLIIVVGRVHRPSTKQPCPL